MNEYLNAIVVLLITSIVGFVGKIWYDKQKSERRASEYELKNEVNEIKNVINTLDRSGLIDRFNKLFRRGNDGNTDRDGTKS